MVDEARWEFDLLDKDADGTITRQELGVFVRSMGETVTEAKLQQMINAMDDDANGIVDFTEYLAFIFSSNKEAEEFKEIMNKYKTS